ncbi:MAG TPA: phosphotransferase, partial [Chloroflexota bacterium]|nr:phosphotransferase [Chloroflexota bacterium]
CKSAPDTVIWMAHRAKRVPTWHGESASPAAALRELGSGGRVVRELGGNANMHWVVAGMRGGDADGRAVLRRYRPRLEEVEVAYELRVLARVAALRWHVPVALTEPVRVGRHLWCLFRYIPGAPKRARSEHGKREEQRSRGRLLARLHADLATLGDVGQRHGWQRREEVLGPRDDGLTVEEVIRERVVPEEAEIMLAYAERARVRFAKVDAPRRPVMVVHGDLITGNVLYRKGELSGVIDFDFTHLDHRAADFVWTWRGRNDEVVRGYEEVTPLSETDRALLAPCYWVSVLDSARSEALHESDQSRRVSLPGNVAYLQRRSELTGN